MKNSMKCLSVSMLAGALVLGGCGGGDNTSSEAPSENADVTLANGMTVAEQIDARQEQFKKLGAGFKTISDQTRAGTPDVAAIKAAAASIIAESAGMADWFPEGTGPESGVETEALATIWETPDDFAMKIADFRAAAEQLQLAADGADLETINAAFRAAGATCGACHDKYRLDD